MVAPARSGSLAWLPVLGIIEAPDAPGASMVGAGSAIYGYRPRMVMASATRWTASR